MTKSLTLHRYSGILSLLLALGLSACATERLSPPPAGDELRLPWGAVNTDYWDAGADDIFSESTIEATTKFITEFRRDHPGERLPYRMLALSGGGSRGAYGAGVLTGWTATGSRPVFSVVTGISTGALQATAAFLGPDYDSVLKAFNEVSSDDIYTSNGKTALLTSSSLYDTAPLKEMLAKLLDRDTIDAVAIEHAKGRRLFVGTTNLDTKTFTIWDMGKIAASKRPDRLQTYRDVVLASASFPMAFPPVYFPITNEQGETYYQMHVDGGAKESVFAFAYLAELEQQAEFLGLDWDEDIEPQIFVLNNGQLFPDQLYRPVKADALSIAMKSIESLSRKNATASVYYIWSAGLVHGASIHLTFIPKSYDLSVLPILEFDANEMQRLYQFGFDQSVSGKAWLVQEPADDVDELQEMIDIYDMLEPMVPGSDGEEDLMDLSTPGSPGSSEHSQ
jgi:predicted acylesterase/phospholipase RssA